MTWRQFLNPPRWYTSVDAIGTGVAGDNRARRDDAPRCDGDTGKDGGPCPNPATFADVDAIVSQIARSFTGRTGSMGRRHQHHFAGNADAATNFDRRVRIDEAARVDRDAPRRAQSIARQKYPFGKVSLIGKLVAELSDNPPTHARWNHSGALDSIQRRIAQSAEPHFHSEILRSNPLGGKRNCNQNAQPDANQAGDQ